jgi:hypothetical protein
LSGGPQLFLRILENFQIGVRMAPESEECLEMAARTIELPRLLVHNAQVVMNLDDVMESGRIIAIRPLACPSEHLLIAADGVVVPARSRIAVGECLERQSRILEADSLLRSFHGGPGISLREG